MYKAGHKTSLKSTVYSPVTTCQWKTVIDAEKANVKMNSALFREKQDSALWVMVDLSYEDDNLTVLSTEREHQISARGEDWVCEVDFFFFSLKCAGNLYQESQKLWLTITAQLIPIPEDWENSEPGGALMAATWGKGHVGKFECNYHPFYKKKIKIKPLSNKSGFLLRQCQNHYERGNCSDKKHMDIDKLFASVWHDLWKRNSLN